GFRFLADETLPLLVGLETIAIADRAGFSLAVVILLADLVQGGRPAPLLSEVWETAQARLPTWPATLRAAVANGLRRCVELGLLDLERPPGDADCVTRPAKEVAEALVRVARSMNPNELLAVAQADRGDDVQQHLAALRQVIGQRDGIFPAGETWFPAEVVELVSHVPGSLGYEGCTAILLLNALATGDEAGWFDFRWVRQWPEYCALRSSTRDPVLAGIRHLYETDPDFLSAYFISAPDDASGARYGGWNCVPIPVVEDLF
ncbi:MAG: hypothetical protein H7245_09135, partial [Candidatus Saccharibacteria bacterium]|nr:hypothetical protein [Pseudorhodobacter sp.]